MPRGIAISTDTNVAAMASSSESGSRIKSSSMTGRPVQSELPKSNPMTPQSPRRNWEDRGRARAGARALAGQLLGVVRAPRLTAEDQKRHVTGDDPHDHEHQGRRAEQSRNDQQKPLREVRAHVSPRRALG